MMGSGTVKSGAAESEACATRRRRTARSSIDDLAYARPFADKQPLWFELVSELAQLVAEGGLASLRPDMRQISTRMLREKVGVSETTVFRLFPTKRLLVRECYYECWRQVRLYLAEAQFVSDEFPNAVDSILRDFDQLADLALGKQDERVRTVMICAFYMREGAKAASLDLDKNARIHADKFERRLIRACQAAGYGSPKATADALMKVFVGYMAIWGLAARDETLGAEIELRSKEPFMKRIHDELERRPRSIHPERHDAVPTEIVDLRNTPELMTQV